MFIVPNAKRKVTIKRSDRINRNRKNKKEENIKIIPEETLLIGAKINGKNKDDIWLCDARKMFQMVDNNKNLYDNKN